MCGRFTLRTTPSELVRFFQLVREPDWTPRYNIAPTQPVLGIRHSAAGREPVLFHWGLIPSWAEDPSVGARMINARAETLTARPAFRNAFRHRRCLVLADGFYEWKKRNGKDKQPMFVQRKDERPFAFAGLWERWTGGPAGRDDTPVDHRNPLESCTIITTEPNKLLAPIHNRMPAILIPDTYDMWLDPDNDDLPSLQALLRPYPSEELMAHAVSKFVNNPRNEGERCVQPISTTGPEKTFDFG
ncbi:MAG: SOS response-associated peptidase [Planctomycetes bacterium]|nr:SOS response-associated peptidase [Planctomycetota bacterium]